MPSSFHALTVQYGAVALLVRSQEAAVRCMRVQTRLMQLVSSGSRPMTLARRRVSPKVRSMKLEYRTRVQCPRGTRR